MKYAGVVVILLWLTWSVMHYLILTYYGQSEFAALADSLVSNLLLGVLCTGAGYTIRFYRPEPSKSMYILAGILVMSVFYVWFTGQIINEVITDDKAYASFRESAVIPRFIISFFILSLAVSIGWLIHYNHEYLEEKNRLNEAGRLVKDAEITNLVQKIQPHFLFNTLNSVNALIQANPQAARKMVQELSDFLRGTLGNGSDKHVPLSKEMDQLKLYLEIEKVRFGERLTTSFNIEPSAAEITLPPLMLQPLVENAIKFGLYDTLGPVSITIRAKIEEPFLVVRVSNPFDAETSTKQPGTGFGLSSLQKRLHLLYNRNDLLETQRENGIFTSTLKIPQA